MRRSIVAVVLVLCFASAHAASTVASWYGKARAHHKTASGELFNPDALTCASWRYPLGTLLRVTNIRNHKTVVVRVNDRGPMDWHRGLDLSECAAELLGFKHIGAAHVSVTVVTK